MIKFFRKIRKQLLTENKLSKYLLYAIGEIVLVVIGILIALQINEWNTERINLKEEEKVLKQLKSEFQSNLIQINDKIKLRGFLLESGYQILDFIDNPSNIPSENTLNDIFAKTLLAPTFNPTNGVTNDLINSGKLYLIQNDSLRQLISGWSGDISFATEEEYIWKEHRDREYLPFLKKNYSLRNLMNALLTDGELIQVIKIDKNIIAKDSLGRSKKVLVIRKFISDTDLEDQIADMLLFNKVAQIQTFGLKNKVETIIQLIDSELEHK